MSVASQAAWTASGVRGIEDMEGSLTKGRDRVVPGGCEWVNGCVVMARSGWLGG
jgi:hypothetical protein